MKLEDAEKLALFLMSRHGLSNWSFGFNRRKRSLGSCVSVPGQPGRIELSRDWTEVLDEDEVRQTLLHEIAHALVGVEKGHGYAWRYTARTLGIEPRPLAVLGRQLPGKYSAVCPTCKNTFYQYRKLKKKRYCLSCGVEKGLLVFKMESRA